MVKFCEGSGIIPLNGLKLKGKKEPLDDNWTFERANGRSTIDYIMVNENYVNEVKDFTIDDEVWEHCNTPHRLVKATLETRTKITISVGLIIVSHTIILTFTAVQTPL